MTPVFDLAVVGLGLIGGGALRHAARHAETSSEPLSVVGIGPREPEVWSTHAGPFASHYDSGRITRRIDAKQQWAILAERSINEYPTIAETGGVDFHHPAGLVFVRNDEVGIASQRAVASALGIPITVTSTNQRPSPHPTLAFPDNYTMLSEPGPAGFIDPRRLVAAQLAAARAHGAIVIDAAAEHIARDGDEFVIQLGATEALAAQSPVRATRVILAAGAYATSLLPDSTDWHSTGLACTVRPEAVVIGEVSDTTADALEMPSFIYLLDHDRLDDVYVVPPTRYPDGRYYIKIGGSHRDAAMMTTTSEMDAWMRSDDADALIPVMREVLTSTLPDVDFLSWHAKPCLITDTESELPFVDHLETGLVAAFGGNGHAAKSSDAIGGLAARLAVEGSWTDADLDAADFAARRGPWQPTDGSRHDVREP